MPRMRKSQKMQGIAMRQALRDLNQLVPVPFSQLADKVAEQTKSEKRPSRSAWHGIVKGNTIPTVDTANAYAGALVAIAQEKHIKLDFEFQKRWSDYQQQVELPPEVIPHVVAQAGSCGTFVLRYATTMMSVSVAALDGPLQKDAEPLLCEVYARPRPAVLDVLCNKRAAAPLHAPAFAFLYLSRVKELADEHGILVLDGFCLDHMAPTFGLVYASREGGIRELVQSPELLRDRIKGSRILCAPTSEVECVLRALLRMLDLSFEGTVVPVSSTAPVLELLQRGLLDQDTLVAVGHTAVQSILHREVESRDYDAYVRERGGNHLQVLTTDLQFSEQARSLAGEGGWPDSRYVLAVREDALDRSTLRSSGRYFRRVAEKVKQEYLEDPRFFETIQSWMVKSYSQPGCFVSIPMLRDLIYARMQLSVPSTPNWVRPSDWSLPHTAPKTG